MITEQRQDTVEGTVRAAPQDRILRASRLALLAALLLLLAGLAWKDLDSARTSAKFFSFPFQFDESEGMIVAETQLLDRGVDIYLKPGPDLFIAAPYPPVYYLLTWPGQHLAGSDPTFKVGRALSIGATLLAGLCIFGIVFSLTRDPLAGAIGAALWWSLGLVVFWGSLVKPDILALTFGLCGLWWVLARPPNQVWWSLPFFWLDFFTKQTAIAAGIAVVIWLLLTRWRTGLGMGVALAAGAALPSIALNVVTNGGYYYHMYTIHDLPWFPGRFVDFTTGLLRSYGALLVPGMLAVLLTGGIWLWQRLRKDSTPILPRDGGLLLVCYFGMALVAASGTGTHGGNHNHMLEWVASACLGVGVGAGLLRRSRLWALQLGGAVLALVMLAQVPSLFKVPELLDQQFKLLTPEYREGMQNVFQYVTNNPGPAYSDNVGLMLLARKQLWSTDPFTQTHASDPKRNRWSESNLIQAIDNKHFSQIIFRIDVDAPDAGAGDVSPGILQAVRDNYKLDQRNVENIYVPR
jgi:hypothetical protein